MTENLLATHMCVPRTQNVLEVGAQLKPVIQHLGGTHRRSVSGNRDPSCPLCSLPDSKTLYRERLQALLLPRHILSRTIVLSGTIEMSFVTFGDFCNIHLSQKYKKKKQTKQQETYCSLAGAHQLTSDPCHNYPLSLIPNSSQATIKGCLCLFLVDWSFHFKPPGAVC